MDESAYNYNPDAVIDDQDSCIYLSYLTIQEIQGETENSPYENLPVSTQGLVTAVNSNGFYMQNGSGEWSGIWVYNNGLDLNLQEGMLVEAVGYVMKKGGLQGYLVDKKSADSLGIKSVMDIKKHAAKFDSNGDGKADMVACPPGWGCEKQITKHFAELGLGDFINPVKADYSASMADVVAKYKNGKPVLFYTWTPNWTVGALKLGQDVVWIEVPYSQTKKVKVSNATKSKINMGFGADDIRPAANKAFLKANPDVKKMLKKASIPLSDIAAQNMKMNAGEKSERAIKKHAAAWIKANQSTFDSWLK